MKIVKRDVFVALLWARCSPKLAAQLQRYDLDMMTRRGEYAVHEGDLIIATDWQPTVENLLVLGSITCEGLVHVALEDCSEWDWGGSLWVLGDLKCRHFASHDGRSVVVDGNLTVSELAVAAFEDYTLMVAGDFTAHFYYGDDIWADVGGRAVMEYGNGYALPFGYDNAEVQCVYPKFNLETSLARLNLDGEEMAEELVAKIRLGKHFRD